MEKILVSACLLGQPVRYNGKPRTVDHSILKLWLDQGRVISVCPEIEGGLSVPRPPAEIVEGMAGDVIDGTAEVETIDGQDVTEEFLDGAHKALEVCMRNNIRVAILTEGSPSCGGNRIYDGTFSGQTIPGMGVTSALLERHSVRVFSQEQLDQADRYLQTLEQREA